MAQKLEDWLEGEVAELSKLDVGELSNTFFFRDPMRPNYIDYNHFYSPADGVILYQKYIKKNIFLVYYERIYLIIIYLKTNQENLRPHFLFFQILIYHLH